MSHRFLLMPASWAGAREHVARPINQDFAGKAPWVALVRAEGGDLAFVRRDAMRDPAEVARAAAEARQYHAARRFKWRVEEKTWGFFGLFSRPTLIAADGELELERLPLAKQGPRYGVAMPLAGAVVPDDGAPEVLFTPAAVAEARALLGTDLICIGMPKRGMVVAVGFHPFETADFQRHVVGVFEGAGEFAVASQLFRTDLRDGVPAITLMVAEPGSILLNTWEDDDAAFSAPA